MCSLLRDHKCRLCVAAGCRLHVGCAGRCAAVVVGCVRSLLSIYTTTTYTHLLLRVQHSDRTTTSDARAPSRRIVYVSSELEIAQTHIAHTLAVFRAYASRTIRARASARSRLRGRLSIFECLRAAALHECFAAGQLRWQPAASRQ